LAGHIRVSNAEMRNNAALASSVSLFATAQPGRARVRGGEGFWA